MADDSLREGRVEIQPGSWLERCDLERLEDGVVSWTRFRVPEFSPREGDRIITLDSDEPPDTLAVRFYGNPRLWWVIAVANDIFCPILQFTQGTTLRIPSPEYVLSQIGTERPFENALT
jgi:hypothetical protein